MRTPPSLQARGRQTLHWLPVVVEWLLAISVGCGLPHEPLTRAVSTPTIAVPPDTTGQLALARHYLSLVAEARYADAWQLLTRERQVAEPQDEFVSAWSAWGQVLADGEHQGMFLWPAAEDEVRADVWLNRADGSGHRERIILQLARSVDGWRIADERGHGHHERPGTPASASAVEDVARRYVAENYGPLWMSSFQVLHQELFEAARSLSSAC